MSTECRDTGFHKWDTPGGLTATCERCGVVRKAVRVSGFWRGFRRVNTHLRWVYTYRKED